MAPNEEGTHQSSRPAARKRRQRRGRRRYGQIQTHHGRHRYHEQYRQPLIRLKSPQTSAKFFNRSQCCSNSRLRSAAAQSSSRRRSDFRIRLMFIHVYSWLKTRLKIFENFAPQIPERILRGDRNEATGRPPSGDESSKQDPIRSKPGSRSACF